MGKVKLIKGRNLPKEKEEIGKESFGASEKSTTLQKRRVWKTLGRRENQKKGKEGST